MQGHPKVTHKNRRARFYLKCPPEMMLSKLKLLLPKIDHPKAIPGIVVPFIYLKCTSVEFEAIFIIFQCRIPTVPKSGIWLENFEISDMDFYEVQTCASLFKKKLHLCQNIRHTHISRFKSCNLDQQLTSRDVNFILQIIISLDWQLKVFYYYNFVAINIVV